MTHFRTEYRGLCRDALVLMPRFAGFEMLKVWPGAIDDNTLPVIGVLTPNDRCKQDSMTSTKRETLLQVVVRRKGGDDVEDLLDEDSELIEAVINAALRLPTRSCFLDATTVVSNTNGEANIGTLVMSFLVTQWLPPATIPVTPEG